MIDLTSQELQIVTEEDSKRRWSGFKDGFKFRCTFCGHKFETGEFVRFVHGGESSLFNFWVCTKCDSPDNLRKAIHDHLVHGWKDCESTHDAENWIEWCTRMRAKGYE